MIGTMTAILYPVAANGDAALARPLGRAAREREAAKAAGEDVAFTTEAVGPAFPTREAAMAAYAARLEGCGPADRFCHLLETAGRPPAPVEPTHEGGRRWPAPPRAPEKAVWRLQVSYWRLAKGEAPQAREARRRRADLDARALRAIAETPLRAVKPQQPLDIGLFEARLPEDPSIIVPDE